MSDDALDYLAVDCPAAACTDPTNDGACVMVLTEESVVCAYCGTNGTRETPLTSTDTYWAGT